MKKINSFKDLIVWQVASELAKEIATSLAVNFPNEERYRLSDQIIRSSRSVPAQISEGFRKSSYEQKHHYFDFAAASSDETENHLIEAKNNGYISYKVCRKYLNRIIRVRLLLSRLMKSIRNLEAARKSQTRCKATNSASAMPKSRSAGA